MNDEESCMDEEPSALSEFVTNIKSPNRQQEEQPRTSEMVSTEYDTTSITIESIVTSRNEDDDDVVEVLEGSHTPEMVLQPNLISPVLELGVVQPNWAVETVVVVNVVEEEKNEGNEEEDDVEPVVSQVLGNVIEIIEAETETEQQNHDDDDDDNDEVVEIETTPAAETNVIEPATTTAEVEATVGAETNEIGADVVEIETTPNIETTSTAEATTTDEVEAMVVELETTPVVETNSIEATTVTDTETNVIEPAATTAEVEANALEIETTSTAEQTEQIEQMSEEEEEPPKSGNPTVQQPLVVIVAPVSTETTASETTTQNHSTSNKESLADATSERNIDVLSPPKSAETMMSSGTSSSRAAESLNDQTSIASPLSNAKRQENPEKTKSIKTSEKLMLRYRKIRRVRDVRETEIVLVCDVVSARDGRLIDSKQLADMKFTHELSSTSRCKVVCERRVSQAELDNELKQMKEEFEENEENFTDNDENENNENHSDNRSQRVNEKTTTKSVSTSPQETTNRHEKSKSHRGEKRTSSTNPNANANAIANPVGRPRTKSHQERSNRRLAHQDMNDTNSNTSTATTPQQQQQQSARSLRKRKVPFSPSANSSLLGINEDEDDNTTANNEEKSVKRRTKSTRLASPSRQQPSTPTRTDKTPVKDKETAATGTTKTPAAQTTTTTSTSTKKPTDPPLFASLCFDLAPKKPAIVESPLIAPSPNLMETNAIEENFDLMPVEESNSEERLTTATNGTSSSIQIRFGRNSRSLTKKTAVETNKTSLVVNEKKKVVRENNDDEYICISDSSSENIGPVESPQKSSTITKSPSKSPSKPASKSPSMTNGKENNNSNDNNNSSVSRITDPKDKRECRIVLKRLSLDEIARLMRTTPTATPTTPSDKKRQQQAIEIDLSTPSPKSSPDGYSVGELVWARGRGGHFYPAKVRQVELTPASRTRLFTVVYLKPSTKRHVQMAEPNDRTLGDYLTAADLVRFDDLKCSQLLLFYRDDDAGSSGDNESDEEVKRRLYPGFLVAYDSAASPRSVSNYLIVDGLLTDRSQREAAYDFDDDPVLTRLRIPLQSIVLPRKDLLKRPLTTDALIDVKLLKNIESIKNLDDKPIVVNASNTKTSSDSQKKSKMSLKAILSATQPTTSAKPTKTARKRTQTRENPKKRHKSTSKTRTASNSRVKDSHQEKANRIALIDNEDDDDNDDDEEEDDMPLALLDESIEDYESPDIIPDDIEYDLASNYNSNEITASSNSMAAGKTSTTTTTMLASTNSRSGFIVCESSISDENAATIVDPNLISSSRFVGNQKKNSKQTITRRKEADRSSSTRSRLRGRNGSTG